MAQLSEEQARQLREQMSPEVMADIEGHRKNIKQFQDEEHKLGFDEAYRRMMERRQQLNNDMPGVDYMYLYPSVMRPYHADKQQLV